MPPCCRNDHAMERWNTLPLMLRKIIAGIGIFVLGAMVSFGYSYRPLHGALTFKVSTLETRLDERNRDNSRLKDELTKVRSDQTEQIDPEKLAEVESELTSAKRALRTAEEKTKKAEGKRRTANANSDRWQKRYESLRDQHQAMAAAKESSPPAQPVASPSATNQPQSVPPMPSISSPASADVQNKAGSSRSYQPRSNADESDDLRQP